jgi:predicted nucleic acid-binding protein
MTVVLDSWAVLRFLENSEPAASLVDGLLHTARPLMSWINLAEVHYVIRRTHGETVAGETTRDLRRRLRSRPRHHRGRDFVDRRSRAARALLTVDLARPSLTS